MQTENRLISSEAQQCHVPLGRDIPRHAARANNRAISKMPVGRCTMIWGAGFLCVAFREFLSQIQIFDEYTTSLPTRKMGQEGARKRTVVQHSTAPVSCLSDPKAPPARACATRPSAAQNPCTCESPRSREEDEPKPDAQPRECVIPPLLTPPITLRAA